MTEVPNLSDTQREKLKQRLGQRSITDDGTESVGMRKALEIPVAPERLIAIVGALGDSRFIIPVFPHPEDQSEARLSLVEQLVRLSTDDGVQAIAAFSSAAQLAEVFPQARPVPIDTVQLAVAAVAAGDPIILNGRSDIVIPIPALHALASGDSWVAPWEDAEFKRDVCTVLRSFPALTGVRFLPGGAGTVMELYVDVTQLHAREQVDQCVQELSSWPRVGTVCGKLSVVPKPVTPA